MNMTEILNAFAGGISFAVGALVGVSVIAYAMRSVTSRQIRDLTLTNKRIDERLEKQVSALERIGDIMEATRAEKEATK